MNEIIATDPATQNDIGRVAVPSEHEIFEMAKQARTVFPIWASLSFKERAEYILKAREYIAGHTDELARIITLDNGKPLVESVSAEILPACDLMWWAAHNAEKILKKRGICIGIFSLLLRQSYITHQAMGVIGIISPWNYPFSIALGTTVMALMAGNCVLLKPSSATPLVGKAIDDIFKAAGLPTGVFSHIAGGAKEGEAIIATNPDRVVFTGSVGVGKIVAGACAQRLIPVTLELGGKDPAIVREDADLERASSAVLWGAFTNAGQCCASIERLYVHKNIAEKFTAKLVEKAKTLKIGHGTDPQNDIGALTTAGQLQQVISHVEDAKRRGAKILCGGKQPQMSGELTRGYFYEPTIMTLVDNTFACVREETFGPTLPVMTFSDDAEAVKLANDSDFGLNAYIFTKDITTGKKLANELKAGTVVINNCVYTHAIAQTPWGGLKHSGFGRTHGEWGFYELTQVHHTHINRLTFIKDFWWYPYNNRLLKRLTRLTKTLTGNIKEKFVAIADICLGLLSRKL